MFDDRSAAALQTEKQHRFSREAEREHARQARTARLGLANRLLDTFGQRLVSAGKALTYEEGSGKQTAAQGPGVS